MNRASAATGLLLLAMATSVRAEVKPNPLFSDHMVMQAGTSVPVWGTAAPGEKITVKINGRRQSARSEERRVGKECRL